MGMFITCLVGGWFGLHKFIEGKKGLGFLYLFTLGLCGIGWIVDCIRYYKKIKKPERVTTGTFNNDPKPQSDNHIHLSFKVAGVTFKNGRKTRQAILRDFKWGNEPILTIDFEEYEYEGKAAVYVKINDQVVGSIPADTTQTFLEYEQKYKRQDVDASVYGGNKKDDGTRTNYGCEIYIKYLKDA